MALVEESLRCAGLYEAELLLELMLRFWQHPRAQDEDFRNELLEQAAEALRRSSSGERLLEDVPPGDMNLVAALWYAEWSSVESAT
jgi:hypothetical protein